MKKPVLICLILVAVLAASAGGYHVYRLNTAKQQLKTIAMRDNVLTEEVLNLSKVSPNMTWMEHADRLRKNREEREELIRQAKVVEPYTLTEARDKYIKLLEAENRYVGAEAMQLREMFEYRSAKAAYSKAAQRDEAAYAEFESSHDVFDKRFKAQEALSLIRQTRGARAEFYAGGAAVIKEMDTAIQALNDWAKVEQTYYPDFLPARNLTPLLQERIKATQKWHQSIKKSIE